MQWTKNQSMSVREMGAHGTDGLVVDIGLLNGKQREVSVNCAGVIGINANYMTI
jgi:hypothetical protein